MSEVSHKSAYAIVKTNNVAKILSNKNILKLKIRRKEKMSSLMVNHIQLIKINLQLRHYFIQFVKIYITLIQ